MKAILPWIAAVGFCVLFVRLGFWQLDREAEKRAYLNQFAQLTESAQPRGGQALSDLPKYVPTTISGQLQAADKLIIHENRVRNGRPGVHIWQQFRTRQNEVIAVNHGWLASPDELAQVLPQLMQTDVQTLTLLRSDLPPTGIRLGELSPEPEWPANTPRIEPEWLKQIWGDAIDSRQVWLRNSPPAPFVAEWRPETMPPEKHHAYAVTWFTMAIVVAALAIGLQLYAWRSR